MHKLRGRKHSSKALRAFSRIHVVQWRIDSSSYGIDYLERYESGNCTGIMALGENVKNQMRRLINVTKSIL